MMTDGTVLIVSEPGGSPAAEVALDRFTDELRGHLPYPVALVERPLAAVDLSACRFLLGRARNLDAALALAGAAGVAPRTIALDVVRSAARVLVERHGLAGVLPVTSYRAWQHAAPGVATGRGLWGRLDLAPRLGASVLGGEQTARYGLLDGHVATLPAFVAAYLAACDADLAPRA
jgi:hypothetical protein